MLLFPEVLTRDVLRLDFWWPKIREKSISRKILKLENKLDLNIKMPEIIKKSDSAEDLGSEGHGSPRSSTNPSPSPTLDLALDTKHPLQNQWTLWYYKIDRSKSWEDNQREVIFLKTTKVL